MDNEQSVIEHLGDLRKRLIISLITFVFFLVLSLFFVGDIFKFLQKGMPAGEKMVALGPGEVLKVYMVIAGVTAIALTIPVLLYQAWIFVSPALTDKERKITGSYIPLVSCVFLAGIAFGYFFLFPTIYAFFYHLGSSYFTMMQSAGNYFSFMAGIVIPFGFIFELPIVILFLTRLGLITPKLLKNNRKYVYLGLTVLGAMLSPPDFVSHISTTIPMMLLYEIGITLSQIAYNKRLRQLQ